MHKWHTKWRKRIMLVSRVIFIPNFFWKNWKNLESKSLFFQMGVEIHPPGTQRVKDYRQQNQLMIIKRRRHFLAVLSILVFYLFQTRIRFAPGLEIVSMHIKPSKCWQLTNIQNSPIINTMGPKPDSFSFFRIKTWRLSCSQFTVPCRTMQTLHASRFYKHSDSKYTPERKYSYP